MALQRLAPTGIFKPASYSQVVLATGRRMVFVSGQVSIDAEGNLVAPGDLAGQARQVYANLRAALAGAGAGPADVAKITVYVVGYAKGHRPLLTDARSAMFGADVPASTLVGVQALAEPEYLVEVEAIAVID